MALAPRATQLSDLERPKHGLRVTFALGLWAAAFRT